MREEAIDVSALINSTNVLSSRRHKNIEPIFAGISFSLLQVNYIFRVACIYTGKTSSDKRDEIDVRERQQLDASVIRMATVSLLNVFIGTKINVTGGCIKLFKHSKGLKKVKMMIERRQERKKVYLRKKNKRHIHTG